MAAVVVRAYKFVPHWNLELIGVKLESLLLQLLISKMYVSKSPQHSSLGKIFCGE